MNDLLTTIWDPISETVGVPLDGISFIYDAFDYVYQPTHAELASGVRRHITAADLCDGFVRLSMLTFGDDYQSALNSWNLGTSEKLGAAVYGLIGQNAVGRQESDSQGDFDGRFDFSQAAPADQPYRYSLDALRRQLNLHSDPRRIVDSRYFGPLTWISAIGVTIGVALLDDQIPSSAVACLFVLLVYGIGFARSKYQYPYRYSVRSLLVLMTIVALALGVIAFWRR